MTNEQVHITKEEWMQFSDGTLDAKEEERLYNHVGCCTYCAEQFANIVELDFFVEPPVYLYEEILERSKKVDVQAAVAVQKTSKQVKLLMYSLKVGFAVAASIFLLTITTAVQENSVNISKQPPKQSETSIAEKINEGSGKITSRIQKATNNVFELELKEEIK